MVTAVSNSNVYVLDYSESQKVRSRLLDTANKAGSSNEILRDVLGLPVTIPIWADEEIQHIIDQYAATGWNPESLRGLRADMARLGLDHLFPEVVGRVFEKDT